jgi:hypothetical protein
MGSKFKPFWNEGETGNPGEDFWSPGCRLAVFALASTSILSLLAEFYGVASMRKFTLLISLPALVALLVAALYDRTVGSQRLWRGIVVGSLADLVAASPTTASGCPSCSPRSWASNASCRRSSSSRCFLVSVP